MALRKDSATPGMTPARRRSPGIFVSARRGRRRWRRSGGCCPGAGSWSRNRTNGPGRAGTGSPPSCPTSCGRPTSPTGSSPTAPRSRSSTSSTTTPGCWSAPPPARCSKPLTSSLTSATAITRHGRPERLLTDNGAVFTGANRGHGWVALERELVALGIASSRSRPYHPQTCGKVERFHQTVKNWLARQTRPRPCPLQSQLDTFADYYNTNDRTAASTATPRNRVHARPGHPHPTRHPHQRTLPSPARPGRPNGKLTLRHASRLHHIGVGRPLDRYPSAHPHPRAEPADHRRRHRRTDPPTPLCQPGVRHSPPDNQ